MLLHNGTVYRAMNVLTAPPAVWACLAPMRNNSTHKETMITCPNASRANLKMTRLTALAFTPSLGM